MATEARNAGIKVDDAPSSNPDATGYGHPNALSPPNIPAPEFVVVPIPAMQEEPVDPFNEKSTPPEISHSPGVSATLTAVAPAVVKVCHDAVTVTLAADTVLR